MERVLIALPLFCLLPACSSPPVRPARFPIVELEFRDRTEKVELKSDYGYIVDCHVDPQSEKEPAFYVFDRPRDRRFSTKNWQRFVEELRGLPDGIEIDAVSKCTVPYGARLPQDKKSELEALLKEKSFQLAPQDDLERHSTFCYCETTSVRILSESRSGN